MSEPPPLSRQETTAIEAALRDLLKSPRLRVVLPAKHGATAELMVGGEVVGTVVPDDDADGRSFILTVPILAGDL